MTILLAMWVSMVFTGGITQEICAPKMVPYHSTVEKIKVKKHLRYRLDSF